jgi:hypothetical protein
MNDFVHVTDNKKLKVLIFTANFLFKSRLIFFLCVFLLLQTELH